MKRLFVFSLLAFLFWGVAPAGANQVPVDAIAIACDGVSFDWADFPERPVDLNVHVEFADFDETFVHSTDGARDGAGTIPLALTGSGTASVTVSWTLQKDHQSGPVFAELDCETTTTSTSSTVPSTTVPTTAPGSPPTTVVSNSDCGPDTLACTGTSDTAAFAISGVMFLALGFGLVFGTRTKRAKT